MVDCFAGRHWGFSGIMEKLDGQWRVTKRDREWLSS
jgi:hypothetical protein